MGEAELDFLRDLYSRPMADWSGLVAERADPEVEFVTRDGRSRGKDAFRAMVDGFAEATERRFEVEFEIRELIEAGDGTIIALLEVRRRSSDSDDYLTAWPANAWRFRDGKIVFFEGYQDPRAALKRFGVQR